MKPIDICYTPLDIPDIPEFDSDALNVWLAKIYAERPESNNPLERATVSEKLLHNRYPWKKVYVYFSRNNGWQNNFDVKFPQLAEYFFNAFGLSEADVEEITMLPTREDLVGSAFWHADRDPAGLRLYLENDKYIENPLYFRKSKIAYDSKQPFPAVINDSDPLFEDERHLCKLLKPAQGFYLNNIRGVHNYYVNSVPAKRMAVVIKMVTKDPRVENKINDLIVKSAEKYKDHAIFY